jgi:aspartate aminotransferase
VLVPEGAFYVFFGITAYLGKSYQGKKLSSSMEICEYLLDRQLLATVPGTAFGMEGFIRISFASALSDLALALDRLENGLTALT